MPVLTQKEYKKRNKKPSLSKKKEKKLPQVSTPVVAISKKFTWILLHPENGVHSKQNFEDTITLEGKEYKRECVEGILRTTEEVLVKFLMKKGYELMEKKKCQ